MRLKRMPVVITGVGVLCPLGRDAETFWANLVAGRSAVGPATTQELAGVPNAFVGAVPDSWLSGPASTGQADGSDGVTDTVPLGRTAALASIAAGEALAQARLDRATLADIEAGLVVGQCQAAPAGEAGSYRPFHDAADHIASRFGLTGPRFVVSTACAAGGNAIGAGRDLLWAGSADIVLAGGADSLQRETHLGFGSLQALSAGPTAPYSASDGLSLGEGAAFCVLETLDAALARGATVLAEVAGYGLSADAYHATAPDPSGRGALEAVRRALDDADLTVADVSYVNGHGTGTPANDAMESKVMRTLFGGTVGKVPISSTKSAIGHSLGAAGAIEAVTCVLALVHGVVPPTVNVTGTAPEDLDIVPDFGRPASVEVTLSNNYAFGGNNCSLVLEKPGRRVRTPAHAPVEPIVISGIGVVGGYGVGIDAWRTGLASGRSAIAPFSSIDGSAAGCSHGVEPHPFSRRPLAAPGLWRHMDSFGRNALAATTLAWQDAGIRGGAGAHTDVGLVFGTGYGPIRTASDIAASIAAGAGPSALSFSNVTVNAAAGAVCQAMNFRGPTTTIATGGVSALVGLDVAMALLATGQARRIVLLATDDLCAQVLIERARRERLAACGVLRPYDRERSGTLLGAASVALVLELAVTVAARGGRAYCEIAGVAHAGLPAQPPSGSVDSDGLRDGRTGTAMAAVLRRLLDGPCPNRARAPAEPHSCGGEPAGTGHPGIDDTFGVQLCVGSGAGIDSDVDELAALDATLAQGTLLTAPKSLTGECEAASGGVNLLVAALAIADGIVAPSANLLQPAGGERLRHVTEPLKHVEVSGAVATAWAPGTAYAAALLVRPGAARPGLEPGPGESG